MDKNITFIPRIPKLRLIMWYKINLTSSCGIHYFHCKLSDEEIYDFMTFTPPCDLHYKNGAEVVVSTVAKRLLYFENKFNQMKSS